MWNKSCENGVRSFAPDRTLANVYESFCRFLESFWRKNECDMNVTQEK